MTKTCARCGLFHPENMPCIAQAMVVLEQGELAGGYLLTGRYRIVRMLHHGGMSAVYLAEDTVLGNRQVAVKELRVLPSASANERQEAEAWFAREAYILSSLNHDLIPEFYSSFSDGGTSYIVQEYAAGENLNEVIRRQGPLSEDVVLDWSVALCALLGYLHGLDEPVLFRDLKPANIVLCDSTPATLDRTCPLKVVDFGIARHYQPGAVGTVIGTPGYAPPEQYQGLASPQSDIYALGATMHRLLTGYDPEHGTPFTFPPIRSLNPGVSPEMAHIVERSLQLDPSRRFASAGALGDALFTLAWDHTRGQDAWITGGFSGGGPAVARAGTRSQRAFRWTALLVCLMMVAPGILSMLAGSDAASRTVPVSDNAGCPSAVTDGAGGPYPSQQSADCRNQPSVMIQVLPDTLGAVGFAPSNVTVSPGTVVAFQFATADCTVEWLLSSARTVASPPALQLPLAGVYHYRCEQYPGVAGVVRVR